LLFRVFGQQALKGANSNPILETLMLSNVNLGKYLSPLKYRFPLLFLIKSLSIIAEKREIMAFTVLKAEKTRKIVKNPIW